MVFKFTVVKFTVNEFTVIEFTVFKFTVNKFTVNWFTVNWFSVFLLKTQNSKLNTQHSALLFQIGLSHWFREFFNRITQHGSWHGLIMLV